MKKIILILLVISLVVISGCSQSIAEVKDEDHIGKTIMIRGTVENTIKIGQLSGYTLKDTAGDTIGVSTDDLPIEGDIITVKGVLMKDTLFGYYILV